MITRICIGTIWTSCSIASQIISDKYIWHGITYGRTKSNRIGTISCNNRFCYSSSNWIDTRLQAKCRINTAIKRSICKKVNRSTRYPVIITIMICIQIIKKIRFSISQILSGKILITRQSFTCSVHLSQTTEKSSYNNR